MSKITISKKEYDQLKKRSEAYKKKALEFFSAVIRRPIEDVMEDFRKTDLYTKKFLSDMEEGLKKSSYGK